MTGTDKLRKENQALQNDFEELKSKLQKVSDDLSKNQRDGHAEQELSPGKVHSVEFMSSQYDSFIRFKVEAERQIQKLISRVDEISVLCDHIREKPRKHTVINSTSKSWVYQL